MPLLFDSGPKIRPEEFRLLRDLVNDFCGIRFPDDMQFVMERKLKERSPEPRRSRTSPSTTTTCATTPTRAPSSSARSTC